MLKSWSAFFPAETGFAGATGGFCTEMDGACGLGDIVGSVTVDMVVGGDIGGNDGDAGEATGGDVGISADPLRFAVAFVSVGGGARVSKVGLSKSSSKPSSVLMGC